MNVAQFIAKWQRAELTEQSASQQHFLDLCAVVDHPEPATVDPTGDRFTFERGATKQDGRDGWADVWKRGFFGWEYKGKRKDLDAAFRQLLLYKDALENPPLLVVCDMERIVVHTNFTGTRPDVHDIPLAELAEPRNLEIVRRVFHAPDKLRPGTTSEAITAEAASCVAEIAQQLRDRGVAPTDAAHFLDRVVFCLFAEDVGLLPELLFTRLLEKTQRDPERFARLTGQLFDAMGVGGDFGVHTIRHFNGNLFEPGPVLDLRPQEIGSLYAAARLDWAAVDPSIFGTLFERGLDPSKRAQLGAHYTSREEIEILVDPVVMQPLRREWEGIQAVVESLLRTGKKRPGGQEAEPTGPRLRKARRESQALIRGFHERLAGVKVLDPACGSGNFLYVTLQKLKDLEKEVIVWAMDQGFPGLIPQVGPWQLYGIEINRYAFELAQMTVWIGYLQWTRNNGFGEPDDPVLRPMDNFECKDAILDLTDPAHAKEPQWPRVDFIVGNPPFLGGKRIRRETTDSYFESLLSVYRGRLPPFSDLCCYWFERARVEIDAGRCSRAGLLATQGIRGGANRAVLERINESGGIFFAESDRPWVLDGANVHVSMVGFDAGADLLRVLDGQEVARIHTNLTAVADTTRARPLEGNRRLGFIGIQKSGPFEIADELALELLTRPNPNSRPTSDVLRPFLNAADVTGRTRRLWIVDFTTLDLATAAGFEGAFEHVRRTVKPIRDKIRRKRHRLEWWLFGEVRQGLRAQAQGASELTVTPMTSKHRIFVTVGAELLPSNALVAFARSDHYFLGAIQSRLHEAWALRLGTRLETRPRYTPTTCFETFPFPWPPGQEPAGDARVAAIGAAARELQQLRDNWLNPPEWTREEILEFPGSAGGPWDRYLGDVDDRGIGTVRWPRTLPRDPESAGRLAQRTLTHLYNERPTWLDLAHERLDEAVFAAYGWPPGLSEEEVLQRLLALNLERSAAT